MLPDAIALQDLETVIRGAAQIQKLARTVDHDQLSASDPDQVGGEALAGLRPSKMACTRRSLKLLIMTAPPRRYVSRRDTNVNEASSHRQATSTPTYQ